MSQPLPWGRQQKTYIRGGQVGSLQTGGGLTSNQKGLLALLAVLVGPAAFKKFYDKPKTEVDLSAWNMVTDFETPAIEKRDGVVRIEFCQA